MGRKYRGAIAIPLAVVLVAGVLGFVAYHSGRLNTYMCDGPCSAEYVVPPRELGPVRDPIVAVPELVAASAPDPVKVAAAVQPTLAQKSLGESVGFVVLDQKSGALLARRGSGALTPASTTKLLSAYAALVAVGADTRFATRVVSPGPGRIVLVGGGDPFLDTKKPTPRRYAHVANLTDLAARTATSLKSTGATTVALGFDDSLFSGPSTSPHWPASYVTQNIATPVSALWADQGVDDNGIRSRMPAQAAATRFAALLKRQGITVERLVGPMKAAAADVEVARVESATVAQILESTIQYSDNEAAEVMARHVAVAQGRAGTFDAASLSIADILGKNGIDTAGLQLFDGSGLSRDNRVSPTTLAQTIRTAAAHPATASMVADLPVSGFNGSALRRFQAPSARAGLGVVRAKTGTLTGVHSYAGIVRDADGRSMVFALMTDHTTDIPALATEAALDNVVAALAGCRCGAS